MSTNRRQILAGAAATAAVAAMPAAAIGAVETAPAIAERESVLSMIVDRMHIKEANRLPQSGILSFGGRRIFIVDAKFEKEADVYLFGDADNDLWRLEDYGLTPDDIIERAGMKLARVVDTQASREEIA